jgi:acetylglutamate kinase
MIDLFRAAPHVELHRGKTFVLKVGGACIARPALLEGLARQVAVVHALGSRLAIVHGGGPQTDALQRTLGEEPKSVGGRRITSAVALRALRMATAGELHGEVIAALDAAGVPAVGVAGASAGLFVARRRPPVASANGTIDFGEVGDLSSCDPSAVRALLDAGRVPVVCPPAGDGHGRFLNVNADLAAASLAVALRAAKLVLLTDAPGILANPADPSTPVSALSLAELNALEERGSLEGGMLVKGAAIRRAIDGGVERVHVVSGVDPEALVCELYTNHGAGTLVTLEAETVPEEVAAAGGAR